eukprot:6608078-Pyramimonas_sp.AAC.1
MALNALSCFLLLGQRDAVLVVVGAREDGHERVPGRGRSWNLQLWYSQLHMVGSFDRLMLGCHIPVHFERLPASMIERLHLFRPP